MVSHIQEPKVGGNQDPNAPRRLRQRNLLVTEVSLCQRCQYVREISPLDKTKCAKCVSATAAMRVPPKRAATKGTSLDARRDNAIVTEEVDHDPMQVNPGSSNDDGKVPHSSVNEHTAAAIDGNDNLAKAAEGSVLAQGNTLFGIPVPTTEATGSNYHSGITPWTPVDSSTLMGPPAAVNYQNHMTTAANSMAPLTLNSPATINMVTTHPNPAGTNSSARMNPQAVTALQAAVGSQTAMKSQEHAYASMSGGASAAINPTVDNVMADTEDSFPPLKFPPRQPATQHPRVRAPPPRMRKRPPAATRRHSASPPAFSVAATSLRAARASRAAKIPLTLVSCTTPTETTNSSALLNPPAAENPNTTMDLSLFSSLSATLQEKSPQVDPSIQPHGPPPTNVVRYLNSSYFNYSYTSKEAEGIPIKLDRKTREEMMHLEEMATNPPISATPVFFLPPRSLSTYLIDVYRHEVYFTYPFFNIAKFVDAFTRLFSLTTQFDVSSAYLGLGCSDESNPSTALFQCSLFVILSHAVHFANLEPQDKDFAARIFWKCAKFFLTPELLNTICLAAVQTFLIISVAFNSLSLGGSERMIPAELAHRIARSLGIDKCNDRGIYYPTYGDNADKQTWYGCVMMNMVSHTTDSKPLMDYNNNKPLYATSRFRSSTYSVDMRFFANCVDKIDSLENILGDALRVREPALQIFLTGNYNSFDSIVPHLQEKLNAFIEALPTKLHWSVSGLADDFVGNHRFERPITAANTKFMHMRAVLFRPILTQISIDGNHEGCSPPYNIDPSVKDISLACALNCVNTSISLLDFLYKRFVLEVKSKKEWWWDPYHTSTAGLIILMAQTSPALWACVDLSSAVAAWKSCQEMLGYGAADNDFHRNALLYLWDVNQGIFESGPLKNTRSVMPQMRLYKQPMVSISFRRPPNTQFGNPISPFFDRNKVACPISSESNDTAHAETSQPTQGPIPLPYAASPNPNNISGEASASLGLDAVHRVVSSASSVLPGSASSDKGPSSLLVDLDEITHTAPEHPYNTASSSTAGQYAASSDYLWNPVPNVSPYAGPSNASAVPTMVSSWNLPAPYADHSTVYADPNATLCDQEPLDFNTGFGPGYSIYDLQPSFSNMMPTVPSSNPNIANFGNNGDISGPRAETQAFYQAFIDDLQPQGYYNTDSSPYTSANQQR